MGVKVSDKGGGSTFKPVPAGTHAAVCTAVVGVGPQDSPWGIKDRVYLRFEVPAERVAWKDSEGVDHEGPAIIWNKYTASLNSKSNLRADLEGWRGRRFTPEELKSFDLSAVLRKPCLLTVIHNVEGDKVYANISAISGLVKGTAVPGPEGEVIDFDFESYSNTDSLPKWLAEMVAKGEDNQAAQALEAAAMATAKEPDPGFNDDDIPF